MTEQQPPQKGKRKWLIASAVTLAAGAVLTSLGVIPDGVSQPLADLLQALAMFGL